jgi:hypothetical protein
VGGVGGWVGRSVVYMNGVCLEGGVLVGGSCVYVCMCVRVCVCACVRTYPVYTSTNTNAVHGNKQLDHSSAYE